MDKSETNEQRAHRLLLTLKGPVRRGHSQESFDLGAKQITEALDAAEQRGAVLENEAIAKLVEIGRWEPWVLATAIRQRQRKEEAR